LLKAKYCPRVASTSCTHTQKPMWPWPVTLKFSSYYMSCPGTCSRKMSSSQVQRFMSYHVENCLALPRNGPTIRTRWSCNLDRWAMTLNFNNVCTLCTLYGCKDTCSCKKNHSVKYRGSSVIVVTEKTTTTATMLKTTPSSLPRSVTIYRGRKKR